QPGPSGVVGHVDDKDLTGEQAAPPDVRAVVGVAEMVGLVTARAEVELEKDLAELRRTLGHVNDEQGVVLLAVGGEAEGVPVFFGPVEALDVRRQAGFGPGEVQGRNAGGQGEQTPQDGRARDAAKHEIPPLARPGSIPDIVAEVGATAPWEFSLLAGQGEQV